MEKKTWKKMDGSFSERQNALSNVQCACGCGQFISNRTAKDRAKGYTEGYIHGHIWKGRTLPEDAKRKMRENHTDFSGDKNPNYGKGLHGDANPNWQGGKTLRYIKNNPPGISTKQDLEFKKTIRARDKKCILCGKATKLHVHHIEPWMEREDLRFDKKNVVTLCLPCHTRTDNAHHKERIKPMLKAYIEAYYKDILDA